jgi:hypothetical protein
MGLRNFTSCILETGQRYPEAIALYLKNGFQITENYGQYIGIEDSVCFQKKYNNKGVTICNAFVYSNG